jgi:nitroreductase
MDTITAINKRKSIRAFKPDPVSQPVLREIMELAQRAPSWANTQPWEFAIAAGSKLEEIKRGYVARVDEAPALDIIRPWGFPEPYDGRIRRLASTEQKITGVKREDREGRGWWRMQGLKNYGAPAVIYICIERSFYFPGDGVNAWLLFDCGLVAENIMLLATDHGLGTVAQAQAAHYPDVLRRVLGIPESKLIVIGIAIGYPDESNPIIQLHTEREPLDSICSWHGFD